MANKRTARNPGDCLFTESGNLSLVYLRNPALQPQNNSIERLVQSLTNHYGPQNWWPAQSRFEVVVGAILVQNTAWKNVETAITNLRRARALSVLEMRDIPIADLEILLRPSGFYRQKATRLKSFVHFLDHRYQGSLNKMFSQATESLRRELLSLNGIGYETADSILLYAGGHPIFVVDNYARRILERHAIFPNATHARYDEVRNSLETAIARQLPLKFLKHSVTGPRHSVTPVSRIKRSSLAQTYNELHAMIVRVGVEHCRSKPKCDGCPLECLLPNR